MHAQIKSSDQWSFYQAKGIKAAVVASRVATLEALGKPVADSLPAQLKRYEKEQDQIKEKARELELESQADLDHHAWLGRGVTMFQIAIAISAISVLTRRKAFWFVAIAFGGIGLVLLVIGADAILHGWMVWVLKGVHLWPRP
jgi:hypothetical protein